MAKQEKIIGIDLGTTNSCVAVMEGSSPVVIPNAEGGRTTPSVVAITDSDVLVGNMARRQQTINEKRTVSSIKRFMAKRREQVSQAAERMVAYELKAGPNGRVEVVIGGKAYTPEEISAKILTRMKETAEAYLGEKVSKAVITVPAYFNDAERQATKDAGKIAGLDVVRIINEPTAAALAYGLNKRHQDSKIAVYDLGGGTFDISILELGDGVFEVKSTNGDVSLGGDDFDAKIVDWLLASFRKKHGVDLAKDATALQRIREEAEKAKIALSGEYQYKCSIPFITATTAGPLHLDETLTRAEFEKMSDDLIRRTIEPCRKALADAKLTAADIDEVILVGGSTRIPKVQQAVAQFFGGKEPNKSVNPDEAVALGAAIQAGVLAGEVQNVVLLDVLPISVGIETLGGVFVKLIEKNTTIPTKNSQTFSTAEDNQPSVDILVFQGERPMARQNRLLGQFQLQGIAPARRGLPQIEVTFNVDANGILHVSAKDKGTGKENNIRIEGASNLSKEEIARMEEDARVHAEEDRKKKEEIEKMNKADATIHSSTQQLEELGDKIPADKRTAIQEALEDLKKAHEARDMAAVDEQLARLEQAWHAASAEIYAASSQQGADTQQEPGEQPGAAAEEGGGDREAEYEEVKGDE